MATGVVIVFEISVSICVQSVCSTGGRKQRNERPGFGDKYNTLEDTAAMPSNCWAAVKADCWDRSSLMHMHSVETDGGPYKSTNEPCQGRNYADHRCLYLPPRKRIRLSRDLEIIPSSPPFYLGTLNWLSLDHPIVLDCSKTYTW